MTSKSKTSTGFAEVLKTTAHVVPLSAHLDEDTTVPFRFKGIIDSNGDQIGAVTDRYALVQNMTVAQVLADTLHDLGIDKTDTSRGRARYRNGRSRFDVHLDTMAFSVPGDPSDVLPTVQVGNGYGGTESLTLRAGLWRLVCTNGMISVVRAETIKLRHVGEMDYDTLYPVFHKTISKVMTAAQDTRETAALLADVEAPTAWVDKLLEDVADRYQPRVLAAVQRNTADLGNTAWAVAQAISEVATHEMPVSWATEDWATRSVQDLVKVVA